MKKDLAVIMSVYINDRLEFVKLAVQSVLQQTYSNFDFYIQYDGPIKSEIENFFNDLSDSRIIIRKRNQNKGLAYSLNELLSTVLCKEYKFIARMDADDICMENRFERQLSYFDNHPDVECLGTWAIEINSKGEEYYRKQMPEQHNECNVMFHKRDCMIHPTVMYRRSYIEKAGLYSLDTYFGEDTMMWAQGFKAGCVFANVPEYLLQFRLDDNFFERRRGWKHAKGIFTLRRRVNKMLNYGIVADFWAFAYAAAKMMPKFILNIIYKTAR
jgi:glycosyltransferase involved in cell wall biosynthesis